MAWRRIVKLRRGLLLRPPLGATRTKARLRRFHRTKRAGHTNHTHAVAFLPNDREFLSCGHDGMRHWRVETGTQLHSADLHGSLFDVAVSPDGLFALAAHADKTL